MKYIPLGFKRSSTWAHDFVSEADLTGCTVTLRLASTTAKIADFGIGNGLSLNTNTEGELKIISMDIGNALQDAASIVAGVYRYELQVTMPDTSKESVAYGSFLVENSLFKEFT